MDTITFKNLPKLHMNLLAQLVQDIVNAISPAKIICYGYRINTINHWSCFAEPNMFCDKPIPTFYLLILTNSNEKRSNHEISDLTEQCATSLGANAAIISQHLETANNAFENNSRFISAVYNQGTILFNIDGSVMPVAANECDISDSKDLINDSWNRYFGMSQRFLTTADFCFSNEWYEQAVFDLHQSVEHACAAVLRVIMGFRPTTHNISRLLGLIGNFSQALTMVFPRQTKEETDLFNILNRAYSESRYNDKYVVSVEIANILRARVADFLSIAQEIYDKKRLSLESNQPISFPLKYDKK